MPRRRVQRYTPPPLDNLTLEAFDRQPREIREPLFNLLMKTYRLAATRLGWTMEGDVAVLRGSQSAAPARAPRETATRAVQASARRRGGRRASNGKDLCLQYLRNHPNSSLSAVYSFVSTQVQTTQGAVKVMLWRLRNEGKVKLIDGNYSVLR
jgi:hypothetical protein